MVAYTSSNGTKVQRETWRRREISRGSPRRHTASVSASSPPRGGRVGARAAVLAGGVELVEEALRGGDGAGGEQAAEQEREGVRR